jgi:hypothetical protein
MAKFESMKTLLKGSLIHVILKDCAAEVIGCIFNFNVNVRFHKSQPCDLVELPELIVWNEECNLAKLK